MAYTHPYRIRFGDVDHAGVAFYPRLVSYCHLAYEDFFAEELGLPFHEQFITHRWGSPVVRLEGNFQAPLSHGDRMEIEVRVLELGRKSVTLRYNLKNLSKKTEAAVIDVTHCYVSMGDFDSIEIPEPIRQGLEAYQKRCT